VREVTISYAQSLDGRIATVTGDSKWISGEATLTLAHELRGASQAILVGIGTVLRDDPELTCRLPNCKSPTRIILDGSLRLPLDSKIARTADKIPTIIIARINAPGREAALRDKHIRIIIIPDTATAEQSERLTPSAAWLARVLDELSRLGLDRVFVEGGAGIITSFLQAGLVDRLIVVTAPIIIGRGVSAIDDLGVAALSEAFRPRVEEIYMIGSEVVHRLVFDRDTQA
jgi:riboflavin-specific deaminase-like protein